MTNRILDLNTGRAMVVTDLHGAWDVYRRLRDKFLLLHRTGDVEAIVFCGDVIHPEFDNEDDGSLQIVMDILRLQEQFGRDKVILLLGNHELPHIYGIPLSKGDQDYTPPFEEALAQLDQEPNSPYTRGDIIRLFIDAPFYVRTQAGVLLSHAGAAQALTTLDKVEQLLAYDHITQLAAVDNQIERFGVKKAIESYERIFKVKYDRTARENLAVRGPNDPRYSDLLRGVLVAQDNPGFDLLWNSLFTYNERENTLDVYELIVTRFLENISDLSPYPQRLLVAGHIMAEGGFTPVGTKQLRLASYTHSRPRKEGRYLLLDCERPVQTLQELNVGLRKVMD